MYKRLAPRQWFLLCWHRNHLGSCSPQEKKKDKYYKKGRFSNHTDGIDFISCVRARPGLSPGVITLSLSMWGPKQILELPQSGFMSMKWEPKKSFLPTVGKFKWDNVGESPTGKLQRRRQKSIITENLQGTQRPTTAGNVSTLNTRGLGNTSRSWGPGEPLLNEESSQEGSTFWTTSHHLTGCSSKHTEKSHNPYFQLTLVDKASAWLGGQHLLSYNHLNLGWVPWLIFLHFYQSWQMISHVRKWTLKSESTGTGGHFGDF